MLTFAHIRLDLSLQVHPIKPMGRRSQTRGRRQSQLRNTLNGEVLRSKCSKQPSPLSRPWPSWGQSDTVAGPTLEWNEPRTDRLGYNKYYKRMVLEKMEHAFHPGDPALDFAAHGKQAPSGLSKNIKAEAENEDEDEIGRNHWVLRPEQALINDIVTGATKGQYHLIVGEKGTGKSSMILDAMAKIDGEGVAFLEAHADPEIFRIRLGKALNFAFHEDNVGSLFSIRGPRDANALLDVERAFNKLERVAMKRRAMIGKPLILIFNSMHLIRDNEEGRDLLELLQQRAEAWAASNLVRVFTLTPARDHHR